MHREQLTPWTREPAPGAPPLPRWMLTSLHSDATGVLVPAAIDGREALVVQCAELDGEPVAEFRGRAYVRVKWLRLARPDLADWLDDIELATLSAVLLALTPTGVPQ